MTKENHCSLFQLNVSKPDINLNRETAKFLLDHGFNFDQLYSSSADYSRNKDNVINQIIHAILSSGRPIVLHNGMLDLCHLYSSFIGELPSSLEKFNQLWATILHLGGCSLLDSKLICRGLFKLPHSSLGFCYLWSDPNLKLTFPYRSGVDDRSEKMNEEKQLSEMKDELPETKSVRLKFGPSSLDEEHDCITWLKIELDSATRFGEREKLKLCPRFTQRAFCSYRPCKLGHNMVDLVNLIKEKRKKNREKCRAKRKRIELEKSKENQNPKKIKFSDSGSETDSSSDVDEAKSENVDRENSNIKSEEDILPSENIGTTGAHGASIDAFMAIYTLVSLLSTETPPKPMTESALPKRIEKLESFRNRLNGPNPNTGFLISKSSFVKLSKQEIETVSSFFKNIE